MKTRDIAFAATTSYQQLSSLISVDTDHTDVAGKRWKNITITNNTNVAIQVKNTAKGSAPSGTGRTIASGDSFNYLELNPEQCWFKAASTPTGSVVVTLNQD
jgi:hypothetical protein